MKKILLVGSQHGHELLGDKLIDYIREHKPELEKYVEFYLANPKAHDAKKRFIEEDMNRSYKSTNNTYESRQAKKLVNKIRQDKYDLVLDLHTTNADMETCFISPTTISKNMRDFMNISTITHCVVMDHDSMARSLSGAVEDCIAIEARSSKVTNKFLRELSESIQAFCCDETTTQSVEKHIFYVTDYIFKGNYNETQIESMKNFKLYNNEFYPVLIGSKSYKKHKPYVGFAATSYSFKRL